MDKPDWEEAPADATHWGPENRSFHESWYRVNSNGSWSCMNVDSRRVFGTGWFGLGMQLGRYDLVERP